MARTRPIDLAAVAARFWPKVHVVESGCWLWIAATGYNGYGVFNLNGRLEGAHRTAYRLSHDGDVPAALDVLHRCDTPACVRPDHLFLGNAKLNAADMVSKGRDNPHGRGQTHCKRGHSFEFDGFDYRNNRRHCRMCRLLRDRMRVVVDGKRIYLGLGGAASRAHA